MTITKEFLDRCRFDYDAFADYLNIRHGHVCVREHEKGMKAKKYAMLAAALMQIAVLCLKAGKYVAASKLVGMAHYASRQAVACSNLERCLKRCESILNGEVTK
jgi:hypothetical protein